MTLSVVIVCRDNEATIGRTLAGVASLATEIVALDSGSTDGTIALLEREGARVERVQWQGHVATKQLALRAASCDWVFSIDSDESVEPDLAESLRAFLASPEPGAVAARVNRKVWFAGRFLEHAWQPEWRLRLVRRDDAEAGRAKWGGVNPHDKLEVESGPGRRVVDLAGTLRHDSFTDMADHLANQVRHARVAAESLHALGRRGSVWRLATSPPAAFLKQVVLKAAWRDGWRGWAAAGSTAASTLMKHILLIERSGRASEGPPPPSA